MPSTKHKALAGLNAFTFSGVQVLLIALFPYLAEKAGLSLSLVVGTFALGSGLFLFGGPFWSRASDRLGRAFVLAVGTTGLFLSLALVWVLIEFGAILNPMAAVTLLILSRVVYGLFAAAIPPVAQSLQRDAEDSGSGRAMLLGRSMLLHSWCLNLGRAFSLLLFLGLSAEPIHLITASLIWIIALTALNLLSAGAPCLGAAAPNAPLGEAKWVFALALLFTCFAETLNSSLGGFLRDHFSMDGLEAATLTARLLLGCALGVVLVQASLRFSGTLSRASRWPMILGTMSLVLGSLSLSQAAAPADLWAAVIFFSFGFGLLPPIYLSLLGPGGSSYGKRAGFVAVAHTLGYALGAGLAAARFELSFIPLEALLTGLALFFLGIFHFSLRARTREAT